MDESKEALLRYSDESTHTETRTHRKLIWALSACNVTLLICLAGLSWFIWNHGANEGINASLKATWTYSPVLEQVVFELKDTLLNGSLWLPDDHPPSEWRLEPGPVSDAAWRRFEEVRPIPLTREQIVKMGKDPDKVAKFEDAYWGMGDDAYIGALDIFHQVHCLGLLRRAAFDRYPGWSEDSASRLNISSWDDMGWWHLRHCTDMLMQHMLCTADTGFLTYNWMEKWDHPWPDMSVHRQCKDWRLLEEYRDTYGVPDIDKYDNYIKPEGATELKQPQAYWDYHAAKGHLLDHGHRED